jgi:hypothetical protein
MTKTYQINDTFTFKGRDFLVTQAFDDAYAPGVQIIRARQINHMTTEMAADLLTSSKEIATA